MTIRADARGAGEETRANKTEPEPKATSSRFCSCGVFLWERREASHPSFSPPTRVASATCRPTLASRHRRSYDPPCLCSSTQPSRRESPMSQGIERAAVRMTRHGLPGPTVRKMPRRWHAGSRAAAGRWGNADPPGWNVTREVRRSLRRHLRLVLADPGVTMRVRGKGNSGRGARRRG